MIEETVDRDLAQPGVKRRLVSKTRKRGVGFEPDFLGQVFRVLMVAAVMKGEREDATLVSLGKHTESLRLAGLRPPD